MIRHLNSFLARGGGHLNKNFPKIQMSGGLPRDGGMLTLHFDWYMSRPLNESEARVDLVLIETSGGSRGGPPPLPPLIFGPKPPKHHKTRNCERAKTKCLRAGPYLTSRSGSTIGNLAAYVILIPTN